MPTGQRISNRKTILITVLVFCALFCPSMGMAGKEDVAGQQESKGGDFAYKLGPQNLIQIKIYGESAVNQIYRIDEMGFISHALLGRIKLQGVTVADAETMLTERLAAGYINNPNVTVFVIEHSRFSILGEVRRPGTYEILGRVSVIEAISMAGGFTPLANQKDVKINRKIAGVEDAIKIDASRIIGSGDASGAVDVQANDVIVVSKSFF